MDSLEMYIFQAMILFISLILSDPLLGRKISEWF